MISRRQKLKYLILILILVALVNLITVQTGARDRKGHSGQEFSERLVLKDANPQSGVRSLLEGQSSQDIRSTTNPVLRQSNDTNLTMTKKNLTHFTEVSCNGTAGVVALVTTLPQNTELRQAIRRTWGMVTHLTDTPVKVVFVTGKHPTNDNNQLLNEIKTYGDILVGDFVYEMQIKTTLPLIHGLSWTLNKCRSFKYVLVVNEDTVVLTRKLLERLDYCEKNNVSDSRTWMGKIVMNSRVQRLKGGMFYVSREQYSEDNYPPFCTDENGYVITRTVAKEFVESAMNRSILPIADVFLSIISKERNWTLVDDTMFTRTALQGSNVCASRNVVTLHAPKKPDELISAWRNIGNSTLLKECMDPDLDLVLPSNVDNRNYLDKVLAYEFNNPHVCYDKEGKPMDIFMLVLISTPPDHGSVRKAIRETWCKERVVLGANIRCMFVMGKLSAGESDDLRNQLRQEDIKYGDLIRASFDESFQNLTLKVILGLKWITDNCRHTKYFYKGDEDMFVNFNNIISYIQNLRSRGEAMTKFFVGSRLYASIRYSPNIPSHQSLKRYHVPDRMYFGHFYPPYCSGGGYILSAETVPDMYQESLRTSLINIDDAFQGILTKKLGYGPIGHNGFKNWGGKTDTCSLRDKNTMTVHGIGKNANNLYDVWSKFHNATANCTGFGV